MDVDQFKHVEQLFNSALDLPAERRYAFLERACDTDTGTLETVLRLLRHAGIEVTVETGKNSKKSEFA